MTTLARDEGLLGVGPSQVGVIPSEGRRIGADDLACSWPLPPAHRGTPALDEHRSSVVRSQGNVPQFFWVFRHECGEFR